MHQVPATYRESVQEDACSHQFWLVVKILVEPEIFVVIQSVADNKFVWKKITFIKEETNSGKSSGFPRQELYSANTRTLIEGKLEMKDI